MALPTINGKKVQPERENLKKKKPYPEEKTRKKKPPVREGFRMSLSVIAGQRSKIVSQKKWEKKKACTGLEKGQIWVGKTT